MTLSQPAIKLINGSQSSISESAAGLLSEVQWLLLIGVVISVLSWHVETSIKTAAALMDVDAHLAPNWYFGGGLKTLLQAFSLGGGVIGAGLVAYTFYPTLEWWWCVAIFPALLYLKYFISARRSIKRVEAVLLAARKK